MSKLRCALACVLALVPGVGCYVSAASDNDASTEASTTEKRCVIPNAGYQVKFDYVSGDCSDSSVEGVVNTDDAGHTVFPTNCNDMSMYAACTTFQNEYCHTWAWNEELTGELDWSQSGQSASGVLTLVAYDVFDGGLYCSAQYQTTYTLQVVYAQ